MKGPISTFRRRCSRASFVGISLMLAAAAALRAATASGLPAGWELLQVRDIPSGGGFEGRVVGGLSGLAFDPLTREWICPCDGRGPTGPSRAYRLSFPVAAGPDAEPTVVGEISLPLPESEEPDFEAVTLDPTDGSRWFATEGIGREPTSPRLVRLARDGRALPVPELPGLFHVSTNPAWGPRRNETIEGLAFSADGRQLWIAMERPLKQDGPWVRLTAISRTGEILRQVAHQPSVPPTDRPRPREATGVSDLVLASPDRAWVLERTGWQDDDKAWRFQVSLWEIVLTEGDDVARVPALADTAVRPAPKRLLLDFAGFGREVYNLEGLAWGPDLPDGRRTLVVVADDNFDRRQCTQWWVFAVPRDGLTR